MEALMSKYAAGTSSARDAGRSLGLPTFSIRNIFHGVLNQYPYKLEAYHRLLPSNIVEREAFARWALSKIDKKILLASLTSYGQMKLVFRSMAMLIRITVADGVHKFLCHRTPL
ncbi:uncharacterized protein TNCV_950801 [Trichonephila clavipes]|nr:uncharacterized protein TNCV_950801 [Trichonephila clavipes]